jgi:hypothetical protein
MLSLYGGTEKVSRPLTFGCLLNDPVLQLQNSMVSCEKWEVTPKVAVIIERMAIILWNSSHA